MARIDRQLSMKFTPSVGAFLGHRHKHSLLLVIPPHAASCLDHVPCVAGHTWGGVFSEGITYIDEQWNVDIFSFCFVFSLYFPTKLHGWVDIAYILFLLSMDRMDQWITYRKQYQGAQQLDQQWINSG